MRTIGAVIVADSCDKCKKHVYKNGFVKFVMYILHHYSLLSK